MYEIVNSSWQNQSFEKTWTFFCTKYRWVDEPYAEDSIRYNLLLPSKLFFRKKVIGTIEFIPFNVENCNRSVIKRCKFSKLDELKGYHKQTWEIDKFCINENYQRQGYFHGFLEIFYDHALKYDSRFYIGLMEKNFYRMIRIVFGLELRQISSGFQSPSNNLIPVILDVKKILANDEKVKSLLGLK